MFHLFHKFQVSDVVVENEYWYRILYKTGAQIPYDRTKYIIKYTCKSYNCDKTKYDSFYDNDKYIEKELAFVTFWLKEHKKD